MIKWWLFALPIAVMCIIGDAAEPKGVNDGENS